MKVLKVGKADSFFVKIRNTLRKTTDNIGWLFEKYVDEDGFLYVELKKESIFWESNNDITSYDTQLYFKNLAIYFNINLSTCTLPYPSFLINATQGSSKTTDVILYE